MDEGHQELGFKLILNQKSLKGNSKKALQNKIEYESLKKDNEKKSVERSNDLNKIIKSLEKGIRKLSIKREQRKR